MKRIEATAAGDTNDNPKLSKYFSTSSDSPATEYFRMAKGFLFVTFLAIVACASYLAVLASFHPNRVMPGTEFLAQPELIDANAKPG